MKSKEEIEQLANKYANQFMDGRDSYYGYREGYTRCQEDIAKEVYSKIESLIIEWSNDGTRTAGVLTREIMRVLAPQGRD